MHPLLDPFEAVCDKRPDRAAVSDQSLSLDYKSLRAVSAGLATRIADATQVERVGVMAPTSAAGAVAIFAAWYAGKTVVPLNFLLPPAELARVIADARIDCVVTIERFAAPLESAGVKTLRLDATTLVPGRVETPARKPEDTAVILYTSGTSGDPKGVCLSFDNLMSNAHACIQAAEMTPDQAFLSLLPQFHSFGLTVATVTPLVLGATAHYLPRFSPVAVIETIAEKRISIFVAIASMYGALTRVKKADREALASLALTMSGGEPLPDAVADEFRERFGKTLYEGYGLTETSPVVSINTPRFHKAGSVGRPIPGVEFKAIDEQGRATPPGVDGELLIRGRCVMQGYFNRPRETAAAIRDGWFHTGDIGRIDADGFVWITGRAKDMIIVGGENVFPREIEAVLETHPAVAEAAVVGQHDPIRGELPVAFVILKEGAERPMGPEGAERSMGPEGAASSMGPEGAASSMGPEGAASSMGLEGAERSMGPEGAERSTGLEGAASSMGPDGAERSMGPEGAASSMGPDGAERSMGPEGAAADETSLREHCRRDLAAYKVPRRIHIAKELPRGPTGKVLKRALREQLRGGSDS
jgi:long-chain acyl-CoA synthetase